MGFEAREPAQRWPARVYGVGDEPDPRFTFANERTFLAWVRTSIALLAAGVTADIALDAKAAEVRVLAVLLLGLGVVSCLTGLIRWARCERALRLGLALPAFAFGILLSLGIGAAGLLLVYIVMSSAR